MRTFLRAIVGLILGGLIGGGLALGGGILYGELARVSQREGAYAMAVVFFLTPAGMVLGATAGFVAGLLTGSRTA